MSISIRLTADEEARLEVLASRTGRSKSFYVRAALHEYLDDLESAFAADTALRAFDADGRRSRPLREFVDELGLSADELAEAGRATLGHLGDLNMLVQLGGHERTEADFAQLFERTGFELRSVTDLAPARFSLVEGVPVR